MKLDEVYQKVKKIKDLLKQLEPTLTELMETVDEIKEAVPKSEDFALLPRRKEVLETIKDHQMATFDFLKRRFVNTPESTLHYDLKILIKRNLIQKMGSTKGVVYSAKEK